MKLTDGAWRSDDGSIGACCLNEVLRHAPALVDEELIAEERTFTHGVLFLNRTGITQGSNWHSNGGTLLELLGGAAELEEHDRLWNDVLDETRRHCPNLRAAYAFGAEPLAWFPTQLIHRPEIVNTANACHPMHILMGPQERHLLQYSQTVKLMASECQSGRAGEDAGIRWHLNESIDADDTALSSLEGAKLSGAQAQARARIRYGGPNESQTQRDARAKACFGGPDESQTQRDARGSSAKTGAP